MLAQELKGSSSCAAFLAPPWGRFNFGQAIFPVHGSVYETSIGSYWAFMMITVRCSHCLETFTEVTKERNAVAVVCPSFCFL